MLLGMAPLGFGTGLRRVILMPKWCWITIAASICLANAQYGKNSQKAQEWVEATLTRLFLNRSDQIIAGIKRMKPTSDSAKEQIDKTIRYLSQRKDMINYGSLKRGLPHWKWRHRKFKQIHIQCPSQALRCLVVSYKCKQYFETPLCHLIALWWTEE